MEYSSLIPNYSAPSSVCTSDSGGGSSQGRLRTIRLHRRLGGRGPPTFGFSVRGGREHGTGFFVSAVEPGSEAHNQGLRIGDQIVRVNGFSVVDAIHREALLYIQSQNYLELRVRTVGMIPVKDKRTDPLTWQVVEDDRLQSSPDLGKHAHNGNNEDVIRDVRLVLSMAPHAKLGCGICKGPDWKPGIFVQFTKEGGLAREAGMRPGDQILQCNGVSFYEMPFNEAVNVLKSSRQLDLIIRKGAGLDLFPGESSGYNSSASSVNGDQSPNWGDIKRLSIVKEESIELEDRSEPVDYSHRVADKHNWNTTEHNWDSRNKKKDSPVLRVHFEDNKDETNRDISELSLQNSRRDSAVSNGAQQGDSRLAEIRLVQQQMETKTVVVEVHRSEESDNCPAPPELPRDDEDSSQQNSLMKTSSSGSLVSMSGSSLSSAISQELQRRSKRRENGDNREFERRKNIPKQIDGEKRQQHEQLMDEFKRVHRKMFAHTVENEDNSCCHTETSISMEERESVKVKRPQKDVKEEKVTHQKTVVTKSETRQGVSEVVKEVMILPKKATDTPPPPPPMPSGDLKNPATSWKPSPASSVCGSPPACPTPDYDTSSSVSSSSSPHVTVNVKSSQSHNMPTYATVNKINKQVLNPATKTSQKNNDSVEMQSIESYKLTNPQSQKPKPPDTYFLDSLRNAKLTNGSDSSQVSWRAEKLRNKPRPVSVTIGEYPTGVERRAPSRFDFLPSHNAANTTSETDGSNINGKLQSELTQTLLRSNLRKKTSAQDDLQNGISSAKGTVTISVNKPSAENHVKSRSAESSNNPRSKVSIVTSVPSASKSAAINSADKIKTSGGNNTVTIMVSNGVHSKK